MHVVKPGQNVVGNSWKQRWSAADDISDVSEGKLASYFEPIAKVHHLAVGPEGHVCMFDPVYHPPISKRNKKLIDTQTGHVISKVVEFIMTKSNARNKGYASSLVNWATNLADELGLTCYLDGGGRGMSICERAGFASQDVEERYGDIPPTVPMVRPLRA